MVLPLTLLFTIWSIKVRRYVLQNGRVVAKWGIFYKSQISILYSKVDHINSSEGFLNKMFHNGNISVNTTGSSASELTIGNVPEYKEFYDKLGEMTR